MVRTSRWRQKTCLTNRTGQVSDSYLPRLDCESYFAEGMSMQDTVMHLATIQLLQQSMRSMNRMVRGSATPIFQRAIHAHLVLHQERRMLGTAMPHADILRLSYTTSKVSVISVRVLCRCSRSRDPSLHGKGSSRCRGVARRVCVWPCVRAICLYRRPFWWVSTWQL